MFDEVLLLLLLLSCVSEGVCCVRYKVLAGHLGTKRKYTKQLYSTLV